MVLYFPVWRVADELVVGHAGFHQRHLSPMADYVHFDGPDSTSM